MFSGLPLILSSFSGQEHAFLTLDRFGGNLRWQQELRVACRYVHGDVFGQLDVAALQDNSNTDLVTVQVGADNVTFNACQTTDVDVLANFGDQSFSEPIPERRSAELRRSVFRRTLFLRWQQQSS